MAVRYVDLSATNNGDGTTPAQAASGGAAGAYNTFFGVTLTAADTVWVRRAGTLTIGSSQTLVTAVTWIGWPISTDTDYAGRPAAGTSQGWDNDPTTTFPTISSGAAALLVTIQTNAGQIFKRIQFTANGTAGVAFSTTVAASFYYMNFVCNGGSSSACFSANHATGNVYFQQCTSTLTSSKKGISHDGAGTLQAIDCAFTKTAGSAGGGMMIITGSAGTSEWVRCTFTYNDRTGVPTAGIFLAVNVAAATPPPVFVDCVVDNSVCSAAAGGEAAVIILGRAIVRNCSVKGSGVKISIAANVPIAFPFHFSKIEQTYPLANGALDLSGSGTGSVPVVVGSFLPVSGNTTDDFLTVANGGSLLVAQSVVFRHAKRTGEAQLTSDPQDGMYLASRNGLLGHHGIATRLGRSRANQVARTGGSTYSYRLQTDQGSSLPILLGIGGFGDVVFVNLTNNSQTITLYGAHKGFAVAPSADDLWIEVQSKSGDGTQWATVSSKAGSAVAPVALTSDSSVWTGDSGLTIFKIVVSITQTASTPNWNAVRARFCKPQVSYAGFGESYDSNGVIYLDPTPVVT